MSHCWGSSPELRPSFKNVNEKLNEIYPVKGELIDNLVNMVCLYTTSCQRSYSHFYYTIYIGYLALAWVLVLLVHKLITNIFLTVIYILNEY